MALGNLALLFFFSSSVALCGFLRWSLLFENSRFALRFRHLLTITLATFQLDTHRFKRISHIKYQTQLQAALPLVQRNSPVLDRIHRHPKLTPVQQATLKSSFRTGFCPATDV